MGLTKVFVGNLSFKTKDSDLASEFSSAGKVVSANIITRGSRSLGYGFVELESEEEAQKAVSLMNKKNIDTREINVELARPRDETKSADRNNGEERRGGRGRGRGGRGNYVGRVRRFRSAGQNEGPYGEAEGEGPVGEDSNNNNLGGAPRGRGGRGRGGRGGGRGGRGGGRGGRGRGGFPRPFGPREPSKTTLYVANLPFSVEDNALAELFKDLKSTHAYVVRARNGRSKGFGFVEFANQDDQKAALVAAEKFSLGDRNLIVKVSLTENRTNNQDVTNNDNESKDSSKAPAASQESDKEPNSNPQ